MVAWYLWQPIYAENGGLVSSSSLVLTIINSDLIDFYLIYVIIHKVFY